MEDSLGDYIRISNNISNHPVKLKDTDITKIKDELITLERKKQCENYARKIVEFLIDGKLQPQIFLKTLNFINQEHYQDTVEERAVTKLCGYPVCGKKLQDIPKKQFHISTKSNKVYDITERKNFCSNYCYHASNFVKKQIDTSPLWVRTTDDLVKFTLLSKDEVTSPGIEIDHGIARPPAEPIFTSVTSFTEACLDEAEEFEIPRNLPNESDEELDLNPLVKTKIDISSKYKKVGSKIIKNENYIDSSISTASTSTDSTTIKSILKTTDSTHSKKEKKVMFNQAGDLNTQNVTTSKNDRVDQSADLNTPNVSASKNDRVDQSADLYTQNATTSRNDLIDQPADLNTQNASTKKDLVDLNKCIDELCKSMDISLEKTTPEVKVEKKPHTKQELMEIIKSVEEKKTLHPENPKFSERIINKIRTPQNDKNFKLIIEKIKNRKDEKDDKLKSVLEKLKNKNSDDKKLIYVNTVKNPEIKIMQPILKSINKRTLSLKSIKKCLLEWITIETYIFIYGRERIKSLLNEDILDGYFDKLHVAELNTSQQVKYMNICKKLQLQELSEAKFDGVILNTNKQLKPLPDYSRLKEESKDMNLKVKAFYTNGIFEKDDPNFKTEVKYDEGTPSVLPSADAHSQHAMRRKVFINAIMKDLQKHVKELELSDDVIADVQEMVKTFKLEADNIIFKPSMWIMVAMILIIMFSVNKSELKVKLSTPKAVEYKDEVFSNCTDSESVLAEVMEVVENVDVYVQRYIVDEK